MTEVKTAKSLQGALIDVQILSNVTGHITEDEQIERLHRIQGIVETAIKVNAQAAAERFYAERDAVAHD